MGSYNSKPCSPPPSLPAPSPPPPTAEERARADGVWEVEWRKSGSWDQSEADSLKTSISTQGPEKVNDTSMKYFRVILIGQIAAGKSSFVNSVKSIFLGFIADQAVTGQTGQSLTTAFRVYTVKEKPSAEPLPWRICDTRGLSSDGPEVHELLYLVDGNVPDKTQMGNEFITPSDKHFNRTPSLEDRAHCVAIVIDASKVRYMDDRIWEKFRKIQSALNKRVVPLVVLLTKIDSACPRHVHSDITKVFKSVKIRDVVTTVSEKLNYLNENHIFPVQNYKTETELEAPKSILILKALRQMLRFAQVCLDEMTC